MEGAPAWGTPPTAESDGERTRSERARLRGWGVAGAVVVPCIAVVVLDMAWPQDNELLDSVVAVIMVGVVWVSVAALGYGFRRLTVGGYVWWVRALAPALLAVSVWGLKLANDYGNGHHYPDSEIVTAAADMLLVPPVIGAIGAVVGIGFAWVWPFPPGGRAAMHPGTAVEEDPSRSDRAGIGPPLVEQRDIKAGHETVIRPPGRRVVGTFALVAIVVGALGFIPGAPEPVLAVAGFTIFFTWWWLPWLAWRSLVRL